MVRPLMAAMVSSTKPGFVQRVGVNRHLHVHLFRDPADSNRSRQASFPNPHAVSDPWLRPESVRAAGSGTRAVALAHETQFMGKASAASSILRTCSTVPGVHVVALVPVAGPVPPPIIVVTAVAAPLDLLRANEMDMRIDAARGDDPSLARDHLRRRADRNRDHAAAWMSGFPALPIPTMRRSSDSDVRFTIAPMIDDQRIGDHRYRASAVADPAAICPMPSRMTLPPPNFISSPTPRSPSPLRRSIRYRPGARGRPSVGPYISA